MMLTFTVKLGYDMKSTLFECNSVNLGKVERDPLYSMIFCDKPSLLERVRHINKMCKRLE